MLFVQHFLSVDFAFCTYSQDLLFWSKRNVSAVGGVCACACVYVCGCTYSGEQIGEHLFNLFPFSFGSRNRMDL